MKREFIKPAKQPGVTMAEACRKYNIRLNKRRERA